MLKYFFELADNSKGLRGHDLKLFKPRCKTTARQKFFSIRVVNKLNRLPEDVISPPPLKSTPLRIDSTSTSQIWAY